MNKKITPNIIIGIYFVIPFIVGIVLSDLFSIDISDITKNIFGYLRFLERAGFDIRTKSTIFVLYIVFSPLAWFYLAEHRKRTISHAQKKLDKASTKKLVLAIFGAIIMLLLCIYMLIIGADKFSPTSSLRGIKVTLYSARSNMSFGIFCGVQILSYICMLFGIGVCFREIYIRIKNSH